MKKRFFKAFCLLFGAFLLFSNCFSTQKTVAEKAGKRLVWSDEFNYSGQPDTSKWGYDLGDGCPKNCGWGNNELEFYTADRRENARVENGNLVIEARREKTGSRNFSSARMVTKTGAIGQTGASRYEQNCRTGVAFGLQSGCSQPAGNTAAGPKVAK